MNTMLTKMNVKVRYTAFSGLANLPPPSLPDFAQSSLYHKVEDAGLHALDVVNFVQRTQNLSLKQLLDFNARPATKYPTYAELKAFQNALLDKSSRVLPLLRKVDDICHPDRLQTLTRAGLALPSHLEYISNYLPSALDIIDELSKKARK